MSRSKVAPRESRYFHARHVLVTGGSSGIGLAVAEGIAARGGRVTLIARDPSRLEEARHRIESRYPASVVGLLELDVAEEEAVHSTVPAYLNEHPAWGLVNSAGITLPGRALELGSEDFRSQMQVNYFGTVAMCRTVVPDLIARGEGHVVNVGSLLSVMSIYGHSAYSASKFAVYAFTDALRAEMTRNGVRVSLLLPGDTDTPQHQHERRYLPPETRAIAGSVKLLSAEQVAAELLRGMARGAFEIIPGTEARAAVLAYRWFPDLARWVWSRAERRAMSISGESATDLPTEQKGR